MVGENIMNCFGCGKETTAVSGWCEECYDKDDGDDYSEESGPEINYPGEELYQYYLDNE